MSAISLKSSLLYPDIRDIIKNPEQDYDPIFSFEVNLHTDEKDLDYTDGVTLVDIYIVRDYVENISDYIEVKLSIPPGTFLYDVYDKLDNIEITIITTKQMREENKSPLRVKERYKAVYLLEKNADIPNNINQSKDDLNNQMPFIVTFQLLDRSVETLRIKTTQGNFDNIINDNKDMKIATFLRSVISEQANKILIENNPALDGIDIEEPDNKAKLKSITIPSYTRVVELPEILQEKNIGVYNGGIGCYIQKFGVDHYKYKKIMFIYSLYNAKKYDKAEYKTIFFAPISSGFSIGQNTYKYKDKILRVLSYNLSKIYDNKEALVMSSGSGFRIAKSDNYMTDNYKLKPVEVTESGPVFKRGKLNSEIVYKNRADGLNFAPNRGVVDNQLKIASNVLQKSGKYATIEVSNLDHDFIYPGGKCKIMYEGKDGKVEEIFGVIHGAIITYSNPNLNPIMNYHLKTVNLTSHMTIKVFISNDSRRPWPKSRG